MIEKIKKDLQKKSNKDRAKQCSRFFKTGKGEYGEGDKFIGVTVPEQRAVAKKYLDISFDELEKLVSSPIHEYRLTGFMLLVYKYEKTKDDKLKKKYYDFYIKNHKYVNNWDLVDVTTPKIVGDYLLNVTQLSFSRRRESNGVVNVDSRLRGNDSIDILYKFAVSKNLWERRIAILATYTSIRDNQFKDTLKISKILLNDKHDLIHKAVGWMLREVGKRDQKVEEEFLQKYYKQMPRTMLRYAIEKFSEPLRKKYLLNKI